MRRVLISLYITLGLTGLAAAPAFAAQTGPNCQFADQLKALAASQKTAARSGSTQDFLAELSLRKSILQNTLDCSILDAQKMQNTVKGLPENDGDIAGLKKLYLNRLDEILSYYNLQKSRIADLGMQGSKDMARSLADWRGGSYAPLSDNVANLVLWVKNQDLFPVAENRYAQIDKALQSLSLDQNDDIKDLLSQARSNLDAAENANAQAKDALDQHAGADVTSPLLKQSLDDLAAVYQNFIDITQAVKKLVPL